MGTKYFPHLTVRDVWPPLPTIPHYNESFHKTYQQIEDEMSKNPACVHSRGDLKTNNEIALAGHIKDEVAPEQIAAALVEHIEKLNNQLRKVQDRLGKVRASNRRLKGDALELEENLRAMVQDQLEEFQACGQQTPSDLKEDRDWFIGYSERLETSLGQYKHLGFGIYRKSTK